MKKLFRFFAVLFVLSATAACAAPMTAAPLETAQTVAAPAAVQAEASAPAASDTPDQAVADVVVLAGADTGETAAPKSTLKASEELRRIWDTVRQDDDITVLPPPPVAGNQPEKTEKSPAAPVKTVKPKVKVRLRNPPPAPRGKSKTAAKTPAPAAVKTATVKAPPKEPVLTRRQILEREINRERAALRAAQAQLVSAKKKGNAGQVSRLNGIIKDRELNIKALAQEMVR
ncbi:hypothetical protein [Conchiformibius kuhniae]|uniref:Uncharacterized protein n=1 Tax=Conchiformibius kuhniae TaxID=211502 RepID=A0A8T9MVD9_9NEIS|nr:hypothetical protein [Conchiformibius kuhniae]